MDGPQLDLRLEPSRWLLGAQCLLHSAAAAAAFASNLGAVAVALLVLLAALGLARQLAAFRAWRRRGPYYLRCRGGSWSLQSVAGVIAVTPLADSTAWSWLVVLRLRAATGRVTLVLLADSLPEDGLRMMRACLRSSGTDLRA